MISICLLHRGDTFIDDFGHYCIIDIIDRNTGLCHYHYTSISGSCIYSIISYTAIVNEITDFHQLTLF